jgi:hypothetical protein
MSSRPLKAKAPNVWVPPNDRARLEQLCRYLLRPPLAPDRVRLRADGRVLAELKTVWRDGTSGASPGTAPQRPNASLP